MSLILQLSLKMSLSKVNVVLKVVCEAKMTDLMVRASHIW